MKVLALVVSIFLLTLLEGAAILVLVLISPHRAGGGGLLLLASVSITPLLYGPIVLGSVLSYFDPSRSAGSRRTFTTWWIVVLGLELLGATGIVIYAVLDRAPAWVPVVFIGVGALLVLVAWAISGPLRRYDQRQDPTAPVWAPVTQQQIQRKIVIIAITFGTAFVVVFALLFALESGAPTRAHALRNALVFGLEFAFFASALACIIFTFPISRQLRATADRDLGRVRKFARIVTRGKQDPLSEDERVPAARYAAILSVLLPLTLGYITLLYAGIITQSLELFGGGSGHIDPIFGPWMVVVLIVVLVALYSLQITRIRRARRYVREHADLLKTP